MIIKYARRAQRPRGLRHESISPTRTLGSWVRIPLEALRMTIGIMRRVEEMYTDSLLL
jgi:hypothetical protein